MDLDVTWVQEYAETALTQYGAFRFSSGGGGDHGNHKCDKSTNVDSVTCGATEHRYDKTIMTTAVGCVGG